MPWIWGGLAVGAAGAGLSAFGSSQTSKQAQKQADRAKTQAEAYQGMGLMQFQASQAQKQAAEEGRLLTSLDLGRPGTYELPYEDFYANMKEEGVNYAPIQLLDSSGTGAGSGTGQGLDIYNKAAGDIIKLRNVFPKNYLETTTPMTVDQLDQALKYVGISGGVSQFDPQAVEEFRMNPSAGMMEKSKEARKMGLPAELANMSLPDIIDPKKFVTQLERSRDFRTVSYLTAQADQILRKQGPLWQEMSESVLGPIYQNAASVTRESAEEIHRMVARGGSARRTGLAEAMRLRSMEKINSDKVNSLWTAKLSLDQWAIDNSRRQLAFNQAWVNNQAGIRDEFNNSMAQLTQFFSGTMVPFMQNNAWQAFQAQQAGNNSMLSALGGALAMIGGGMMNYGASLNSPTPTSASTGGGGFQWNGSPLGIPYASQYAGGYAGPSLGTPWAEPFASGGVFSTPTNSGLFSWSQAFPTGAVVGK